MVVNSADLAVVVPVIVPGRHAALPGGWRAGGSEVTAAGQAALPAQQPVFVIAAEGGKLPLRAFYLTVQTVALVLADRHAVQRRLQQMPAAVIEVTQGLPVRQDDGRGVAQRVPLVTQTAAPGVLCRQPAAAVVLKTHRVCLNTVLLLSCRRGREGHFGYLVEPVVTERPRAVFICRLQQAAQRVTLLRFPADAAERAVRLRCRQIATRIVDKYPAQAVRPHLTHPPAVGIVGEAVLRPVAVGQRGHPPFRGVLPACCAFFFIRVYRQQATGRVRPALHAPRNATVAACEQLY